MQNTNSTTNVLNNDSSTSGTNDQTTQMINSLFETAMQNQESTTNKDITKDSTIASSQAL